MLSSVSSTTQSTWPSNHMPLGLTLSTTNTVVPLDQMPRGASALPAAAAPTDGLSNPIEIVKSYSLSQ